MTAVWKLDMPPSRKLVALSLADNANDSGDCWPSVANICARTSLSERTVQLAIRELEQTRFLVIRAKSGSSNRYHLTPAAYAPPQDLHPAADAPTPARAAPQPPQPLHPTPAADAPRTVIEPSEEPSGNRHIARATPNVPRETSGERFDGWAFIDQRMRPVYPRGTFQHPRWIEAARVVEKLVEGGADPDLIAANAEAYCRQAEAIGRAGTQWVKAPNRWLDSGDWVGPFDLPDSPAQRRQDANVDAGRAWLAMTGAES
jgi:hypothetical protein